MKAQLLQRNGIAKLLHRKLLHVKGPDAYKFLHAIFTNDIQILNSTQNAIYGAFLNAKGRIISDCNIAKCQDDYIVDYDEAVQENIIKHWKRHKLRMKVSLDDISHDFTTQVAISSAFTNDHYLSKDYNQAMETILQLNSTCKDMNHGLIFPDPRGIEFGVRGILPKSQEMKVPNEYEEITMQEYKDIRLFAGACEGVEIQEQIPHEVNLDLLQGISFQKGCYVGQELTARTQFKGNVRKRNVPMLIIPKNAISHHHPLSTISLPFQPLSQDLIVEHGLSDFFFLPKENETVGKGVKIIREGVSKPIGKIIQVASNLHLGIGVLRLENILPKEDQDKVGPFMTEDGDYMVLPYQPSWWPTIDSKTGKKVV